MKNSESAIEAIRTDRRRLQAVARIGLLDSPPEETFDRLTRVARRVTNASFAFLSLIDSDRDFLKSGDGMEPLTAALREVRGRTFCHYSLLATGPLSIDDTHQPPDCFPAIAGALVGVRAYIGIPMRTEDGHQIGNLCVGDFFPRSWREFDVEILSELARSAFREMAMQCLVREAQANIRAAEERAVQRERLIANIAHDLRNPLQTLNLTFALAVRSGADEARKALAEERFSSAVATMAAMLDNLLGSAALPRLPVTSVLPASLVEDALGIMQPIADQKSIFLRAQCEPGLSALAVDYQRVLRVFSNLIGNAIKFSPEHSLVSVHVAEEPGGLVRFTILDRGCGIPAEDHAAIFVRHWRTDHGEAESRGLGLCIAKEIIEELGGAIGVHSEPGQGSAFHFTLPHFDQRARPAAAA